MKAATKHEREHMGRIAALGCCVCRNQGEGPTPAAVHHIRAGQGASQRASNYLTIPLCGIHHQNGGHGVAIHAGQTTWERMYGTELELLAQTIADLEKSWN